MGEGVCVTLAVAVVGEGWGELLGDESDEEAFCFAARRAARRCLAREGGMASGAGRAADVTSLSLAGFSSVVVVGGSEGAVSGDVLVVCGRDPGQHWDCLLSYLLNGKGSKSFRRWVENGVSEINNVFLTGTGLEQ